MKCAGVKEVQGLSSVALDSQAKQNIAYQLDKIRDGIKAMHNALSRMHGKIVKGLANLSILLFTTAF